MFLNVKKCTYRAKITSATFERVPITCLIVKDCNSTPTAHIGFRGHAFASSDNVYGCTEVHV